MIFRFAVAAFLVVITSGCDLQTKPADHDGQLSSQMNEIKDVWNR
jgi:hypothetical protein